MEFVTIISAISPLKQLLEFFKANSEKKEAKHQDALVALLYCPQ